MKEFKKGIVPFLLVMLVAFILSDFGNGEIKYIMAHYESLPEEKKNIIRSSGPGSTGMFQHDGSTYAFKFAAKLGSFLSILSGKSGIIGKCEKREACA
jgi:hypothetical protein